MQHFIYHLVLSVFSIKALLVEATKTQSMFYGESELC